MNGRIIRPAEDVVLGLPRIGKIKIGMKRRSDKTGKEYPTSVDYFIPSGKYAGLFTKAYGEKPQTIQIVFPSDSPAEVCKEEWELRDDKGALVASGDGQDFKVWSGQAYLNLNTDDYPELMESIAKRYGKYNGADNGWRVRLTMNFLIPLVRGVVGLWTFETSGVASSIRNCRNAYDAMLAERGSVRGAIWDMTVQFATTQKPNDNSRFPVVSIVPNESEGNLRLIKEAMQPVKLIEK